MEQLVGYDLGFEVADVSCLDVRYLRFLQDLPVKHEVILQWLQELISDGIRNGVLDVPAPIITRAYQQMSQGRVYMEMLVTLINIKFPFPYAQIVTLMLVTNSIISPLMFGYLIRTPWVAALLACVSITLLWAVNFTAAELEDPFGEDVNDLPMLDMQVDLNRSLSQLMHPLMDSSPPCELESNRNIGFLDAASDELTFRTWSTSLEGMSSSAVGSGKKVVLHKPSKLQRRSNWEANGSRASEKSSFVQGNTWPAIKERSSKNSAAASSTVIGLPSETKAGAETKVLSQRLSQLDLAGITVLDGEGGATPDGRVAEPQALQPAAGSEKSSEPLKPQSDEAVAPTKTTVKKKKAPKLQAAPVVSQRHTVTETKSVT
eukprot:TRINITY_DN21171_c0_g2_i1.p1 TRINITY_DN21171_c0_g2~~TRINITY_DN21171_c0_g2_i1.p1  ORF type:complete len:375 (-),score=57.30 TRINITY_DN21171_c0_g2_i1:111-1235(-)